MASLQRCDGHARIRSRWRWLAVLGVPVLTKLPSFLGLRSGGPVPTAAGIHCRCPAAAKVSTVLLDSVNSARLVSAALLDSAASARLVSATLLDSASSPGPAAARALRLGDPLLRRAPRSAAPAAPRRAEAPGSPTGGGSEEDSGMPSDEDMAVLQSRIREVRERPRLPVLMIDAMLPGQRLRFESADPVLSRLAELGEVGVLGAWQGQLLRRGVQASLSEVGPGEWELRGQRHVEVASPASKSDDGLTMAHFEFIEDDVQEVDVGVAKALVPLVRRWTSLVEGTSFEKFDGQVQGILADLGPMPPAEEAGRLAMWVAALVNPLPALGVAYEIRPAALAAATVGERLQVALQGIQTSISHLAGEKPLF